MGTPDYIVSAINYNGNINDLLAEKKFVQIKKVHNKEIYTDTGWVKIENIAKTIPLPVWRLETNTKFIECADRHILFDENMEEVFACNLNVGDYVQTRTGIEIIKESYYTGRKEPLYDVQLSSDSNNRYWSNDFLSHNSMWMYNMAAKLVDQGKNVLVISLEMTTQKVFKRIGSMRLNIPAKDYDEKTKDSIFFKSRLNSLKNNNGGIFDTTPGKLYAKKFNTGECTISDIDALISNMQDVKNKKIDFIFIDYINLMGIEKGIDIKYNLFLKGKHLAEGLRWIADKYALAIITATQTDKAVWGANDVDLNNMPESKAIAETADIVFAIIRNPEMKKHNQYRLKILKFRDGSHNNEQIKFDFDPDFLIMKNDEFYDC